MTDSWDFEHHMEDAKGLVQAVRFTGRSIDDGMTRLRDAFEALANGLGVHLEALEKAHAESVRPPAATAAVALAGVGSPDRTKASGVPGEGRS